MALSNFTRPQLPYSAQSLANNDRFQILTRALNAPPTDIMLDSELNALTDYSNILDVKISELIVGILPGVDDPNNTNFLVSTDGTNQIWTLLTDQNVQLGSLNGNKLIDSTLTAQQLQNGTVTVDKMAPVSVGTSNLINLSVIGSKLGLQAVGAPQVLNNSLTTDQISLSAGITGTQLAAGANILGTQLSAGANILGSQLAAAADIIGTQISAAANILGTQLSAAAGIVGTQLANNTITPMQISPTFASTKATQITATSTTVYTNPAVQQNHPSATKFWCNFDGTLAGTNAPNGGYNVTSVTRISAGFYIINFTVPFANINYVCDGMSNTTGTQSRSFVISSQLTNSFEFGIANAFGSLVDQSTVHISGNGLQ